MKKLRKRIGVFQLIHRVYLYQKYLYSSRGINLIILLTRCIHNVKIFMLWFSIDVVRSLYVWFHCWFFNETCGYSGGCMMFFQCERKCNMSKEEKKLKNNIKIKIN